MVKPAQQLHFRLERVLVYVVQLLLRVHLDAPLRVRRNVSAREDVAEIRRRDFLHVVVEVRVDRRLLVDEMVDRYAACASALEWRSRHYSAR